MFSSVSFESLLKKYLLMLVFVSVLMLVSNIKHVDAFYENLISTLLNHHKIHIKFTSLARCEIFVQNHNQINKLLQTSNVIPCPHHYCNQRVVIDVFNKIFISTCKFQLKSFRKKLKRHSKFIELIFKLNYNYFFLIYF